MHSIKGPLLSGQAEILEFPTRSSALRLGSAVHAECGLWPVLPWDFKDKCASHVESVQRVSPDLSLQDAGLSRLYEGSQVIKAQRFLAQLVHRRVHTRSS